MYIANAEGSTFPEDRCVNEFDVFLTDNRGSGAVIQLHWYNVKYVNLYRALRIYRSARYPLGKIYIVLSDDVERRLRLTIVKRLGGKKGDLSGAIEEAVNDWLKKDSKPRNWT